MFRLFVTQKNLDGSVEHYFHFMFGYLVPFLDNVPKEDGNVYLFRNCGPVMNKILLNIPGYRTEIFSGGIFDDRVSFLGYDNPDFPNMNMKKSRHRLMDVFGVEPQKDETVLIVDRANPHEFYDSDSEVVTSGSSRRSIPNMLDILQAVRRHFPAELVFLEDMGLKEQIELFSGRRRYVLQHGASMSNLLFSPEGSAVLEIRSDSERDYFHKMKSELGIRCGRVVQKHNHAEVDPDSVVKCLKSLLKSSLFF